MVSEERIDQIDAMRLGADYTFRVRCRDFGLQLRPLTIAEHVEIAGRVADRLAKVPQGQNNRLTSDTFLAWETLVLASTSGVDRNDPKLTEFILQRMTPDEIHFLFKQYVAECDRVNPALELMKPEDLKRLVDGLKKSPLEELASQLIGLSFSELVSVCQFLIHGE